MKKKSRKYLYLIVLGINTLMVAMYSPLNPLLAKGITTDQAVFFTIARGLLEGKLAYVDFFDHKGVLLYMILDEPTRNFSPISGPRVREALRAYEGTVISVSHDRKFLMEVCDKLYRFTENGLVLVEKEEIFV